MARKKPNGRRDKKTEEDVLFMKEVPVQPRDRLARKVYYDKDTNISNLGTKKTSGTQITAKKIVKKYRNLARKKPYGWPDKKTEEDVVLVKQTTVHLRDRLVRNVKD